MSKHWKPQGKIVEAPWTRAKAHVRSTRRRRQSGLSGTAIAVVLAGAACIGIAVGLNQTSVIASVSDAIQSGLPRDSGARKDGVRVAFGYCKWGGGTNCVVDGDTFYLDGDKVRIAGIDAPETHPPRCAEEARLGNEATAMLRGLLNGGAVMMTRIDRDRDVYGRLLRNVVVNGADVGQAMVSAGVAREYGGRRRSWC